MHQLSIKRLKNLVEKQKTQLRNYIPSDMRNIVCKINPNYELKGAARVASEHYKDPDYNPPPEPVNLLEQLGCESSYNSSTVSKGMLYSHPEGRVLLSHMMEHATYLHNKMNHTKDAVKIFQEMLRFDSEDNLVRIILCT